MTKTFSETYRLLDPEEPILKGDEWTTRSLWFSPARGPWAPCDSFVGHRVREVDQNERIFFRRFVCHETSN